MQSNELKDLAKSALRELAGAYMEGFAAAAAEFRAEMTDARKEITAELRDRKTDGLVIEAERIEAQKLELQAAIESSAGLKRLALQKKLADIEAEERAACEALSVALAIPSVPAIEHAADVKPAYKRQGRAFKRVEANGHAN
jgi:hypothetical protein